MNKDKLKLGPDFVLPILQGLLASGHYTSIGADGIPHPSSATYDSGPPRVCAVQDAVDIASEMLVAIDDHNESL